MIVDLKRSLDLTLLSKSGAMFISDDLFKSKLTSYWAMGIAGNLLLLSCGCLCAFVSINLSRVEKQSLDPFGLRNQQTCPYTNIQVLGPLDFDVSHVSTSYLKNSDIHFS